MVRPVIYIALFLSIMVCGYTLRQNYDLKQSFHAALGYKEISKEKLLFNFQTGMIFMIKPTPTSNPIVYKIESFEGDYSYSIASKALKHDQYSNSDVLVLIQTNKIVLDPPILTDFRDIKDKINNSVSFDAFTHTKMLHLYEGTSTFNSAYLFSWTNFLVFMKMIMILLVTEWIIRHFIKLGWIRKPSTIHYVVIFGFMLYNALLPYIWFRREIFTSSSPIYFLASGYALLIYPIFSFAKFRIKKFDFIDKEAIKFCVLLGLLIAGNSFIKEPILNQYYQSHNVMSVDLNTPITDYLFVYLFCAANLLVNSFFFILPKKSQSERLKIAETKALKSEAALSSIQSSVNPHFLYNSLNSIATLTKTDPIKTEKMTLALSSFYKYVTNRGENTFSTIEQEIKMINTYLEIEKIRFEDRLKFKIEIQGGMEQTKIPYFLIQPLVENAIKYGYNKTQDTIEIGVKASQTEQDIFINIFDQGKPFDENMTKGYGLRSVTKKLQLLYPERHEISFNNKPKHVSLILKIKSND